MKSYSCQYHGYYSYISPCPCQVQQPPLQGRIYENLTPIAHINIDPEIKSQLDRIEKKLDQLLGK